MLRESDFYFPVRSKETEPEYSISYKIACAYSKYSDQPAHPRRLIGVFAVRLRTLLILSYLQNVAQKL